MFLVGLTGGIASGKSSVSTLWEQLGAEVIDADEIAREVVVPGSKGLQKIIERFGGSVLDASGNLDRAALARIIFENSASRKDLESILHPLISAESRSRISEAHSQIVVYVIPLLVESNSDLPFDYVVTVEAPVNDQINRMMQTRGMAREQAEARIAAQASPAQRAQRADAILNSNQSLDLLLKDAGDLFSKLKSLANAKAQ